jgi:HlyD family secretion protein
MIKKRTIILLVFGGLCCTLAIQNGVSKPDEIHRSGESEELLAERTLTEDPKDRGVANLTGHHVAGLGLVEPRGEIIELSAPESGIIRRVLVEEGQTVMQDDVVVELDQEIQQQEFVIASNRVQIAYLKLLRLQNGASAEELAQAQARVQAEEANRDNLKRIAERKAGLFEKSAISREEMDQANADYRIAVAKLELEQALWDELKRGTRKDELEIAAQEYQESKAAEESARVALERRKIRAPQDGTILRIQARAGELHTPEQDKPLLQIGDLSQLMVRVEIDERDALYLSAGAEAYVTDYALETQQRAAVVERILPRVGSKTNKMDRPGERVDIRVVEVLLKLKEQENLMPGMRVMAMIQKAQMVANTSGGKK